MSRIVAFQDGQRHRDRVRPDGGRHFGGMAQRSNTVGSKLNSKFEEI